MPRVGISIEEQTSSSQFKFEEGRGVITAAVITVEKMGEYDAKCGYKLTIQRKGRDGKVTDEEPVEEFLSCGPTTKFHPSNATSENDEDPEDLGDDIGVEGNCLLAVEGAGPDKKSKASLFGKYAQEKGLRPKLLNGYAPYLIGLDADFRQLPTEKGTNFTGKRDPTCLIIKENGNIYNLSEMNSRVEGGATSTPAATRAPAAAKGKVNGVAKATPTPAPVAAAATSGGGGGGDVDEVVEAKAVEMLAALPAAGKAQILTRQKMGTKLTVIMAKHSVPISMHKPIQALIANAVWLDEKADDFGWTVEGDNISIPASA